jgi:hypothetical protein
MLNSALLRNECVLRGKNDGTSDIMGSGTFRFMFVCFFNMLIGCGPQQIDIAIPGDTGAAAEGEGEGEGEGEASSALDADGDGWTEAQGDCDDGWAGTYPGAPEYWDSVDNDCDGEIDDGCSNATIPNQICDGSDADTDSDTDVDGDGYSEAGGDCDDTSSAIHPGATEACDAVDSDCDGDLDEGCSGTDSGTDGTSGTDDCDEDIDADGDGYNECEDCDDGWRYTYPGAPEYRDGADQDCDGEIDDGCSSSVAWNGAC